MTGRFSTEGLVLGTSLVAVGLLWTLANLGRLDLLPVLRTWWPLVLVFWGTLELLGALGSHRDTEVRK